MKWKWKINHIDTTLIDLDLDVDINIVNMKTASVWWSTIGSSIHEKVKQHSGWVEKKVLVIKKPVFVYLF